MPRTKTTTDRDRLIHIRLSDDTHRRLKVLVAEQGGTIQDMVAKLIEQRLTALKGPKA